MKLIVLKVRTNRHREW